MFTVITSVLIYVSLGFVISIFLKRNDIADVMWGPGIFLGAVTAFLIYKNGPLIALILIFFWSLRIFLHIGSRFITKKEEDFRYKVWRDTWKSFYLRSYLQVFLLQGLLMILVASSVIFMNSNSISPYPIFVFLGTFIAIFALIFETTADQQLKKFLKTPPEQKTSQIMQTGLWKFSRHPNYFGEVCFWWGIFITTLPSSSVYFINPLFLISPITITFLILYVSGIPMLEAKYKDNQEFQTYKSKTSAFFPWFQKN